MTGASFAVVFRSMLSPPALELEAYSYRAVLIEVARRASNQTVLVHNPTNTLGHEVASTLATIEPSCSQREYTP